MNFRASRRCHCFFKTSRGSRSKCVYKRRHYTIKFERASQKEPEGSFSTTPKSQCQSFKYIEENLRLFMNSSESIINLFSCIYFIINQIRIFGEDIFRIYSYYYYT